MKSETQLLRDILIEGKARTQEEIRAGFEKHQCSISQPKISRLLHQIAAVKVVDTKGKTYYRLPHEAGLIHELTSTQTKTMVRQWVLDVITNDTLIIIHTTPGAASMVARIIDQHRTDLNISGTIAGDDTIFIAPRQCDRLQESMQLIHQLLEL